MMAVSVPTMEEFEALEARVMALEADAPPNPDPPPVTDGTQAKRIIALDRYMGVNTFSSLDQSNVWGSWPADYSPPTVIKCLRWIVQRTGHTVSVREYHYDGRTDMQRTWLQALKTEFPDMANIMCIGANGGVGDVASMIALHKDVSTGVVWVEGENEPNTNFGSGEVPYDITKAVQEAVFNDANYGSSFGPSIVAGTPHPEGWITGYCGTQNNLDLLNANMDIGNGHYYPPGAPDVPSTGYSVNEYIGGLWGAYAQNQISLTEFHPTLYNSQGNNPGQPGWSDARDAYYTLTTVFRCAQNGTHSLWWYALLDYGTVYTCGLFPTNESNPRCSAFALRALCSLCADPGNARATFSPGRLDFTMTGGDANTFTDLYQGSEGTFYLMLWRSLDEPGGQPVPVEFSFPAKPAKIEEFDLTKLAAQKQSASYTAVQVNTARDGKLRSQLDGSARVIRITP